MSDSRRHKHLQASQRFNTYSQERGSLKTENGWGAPKDKWLNTAQAADYLSVSTGSIYNLIYLKRLRPHKLGNRNRFKKEQLDKLLRK